MGGLIGSLLPKNLESKILLCSLYICTLPVLADVLKQKKLSGQRESFSDTYIIIAFPIVITMIGWMLMTDNKNVLFALFFPSIVLTSKLTEFSWLVRFRWYHLGIYMVLGYHIWEGVGFFWWHAVSPPFHIFFP